jgi:putative addiction module killer protein
MIKVLRTPTFSVWLRNLADVQARARVEVRIRRLTLGNPGDVKPVGEGVSEMRIDHGPGYRVYFVQHGNALVVVLAGGDRPAATNEPRRKTSRQLCTWPKH